MLMNPEIEKFVAEKMLKDQAKKEAELKAYRERVIRATGLMQDGIAEVSTEKYYETANEKKHKIEKDKNDDTHYYIKSKTPLEVTDEEFAIIESAFSAEELEELRKDPSQKVKEQNPTSKAAGFFSAFGVIIIILGFILAIVILSTAKRNEDVFATLLSTITPFVIYACFCFCASELFKWLQAIYYATREKH